MADVAREAGVSLKTVSRVVNREPHTRPEVVERVTRAIAELGWVAHGGARAMRTGRTGRIAIAVSSLANPTTTMLVEALVAEAGRRGLTVGLEPTHDDPERAERVLAACGRLYDGVLVLGGAAAGVSLAGVGGTVVTVQGARRGPDHLGSDLDAAAGVLVRHVATMRRRRVVLLGVERASDAEADATAVTLVDAVARALAEPPVAVLTVAEGTREAGAAAAETLLGDHPDADAVLCETDEIALGLLSALARRGVPLPGRIAITGFGATEDGRYTTPSLTTVDPGYPLLAREAFDVLDARLAGRPAEARRPTPIELIRRESTLGTVLG
ncbi:LacI family DNA-binding transcriptional regulator [Microbacterium sp. NEAU-LLB]|uniref:LacI family DNA-binding transcriptional regulator n=2 Tax=Microbacterium stercoris TaxID=2820289 RepID=A0A939TYW7_9MICO|nr:LacI family DNA-binding transcriptional regulator [Microbacterium stercoris]